MSEQAYERKKDFVNHALSRCVAAMYPNVCRVAYHTRDTDEGQRALYRLAIVVWIIVLALVLCMDTAG